MAPKTLQEILNEKEKQNNTYQFEDFPYPGSFRVLEYRPFRENVRSFLPEFADKVQDCAVSGMSVWSTTLVTSGKNRLSFPLYTIEETVDINSDNPFCDYCKLIGWGHHFVSQRKYHFIIPASDRWNEPWKDEILALTTHILYGFVHCNGYGHLIRSSNTPVMNFWDRLCSYLCTRKISVRDETILRLLYGVVNGQSWYGRWGYEFSLGTFGVTEEKYKAAIEYLRSFDLDKIVNDSTKKGCGTEISKIVNKCVGATDVELKTLSDLLRFMMGIGKPINADALATLLAEKKKTENSENTKKTAKSIAKKTRNLVYDTRLVLNQMMMALNESQGSDGGNSCIGRKKMLDKIKNYDRVESTSLINFVLGSITRFAIGNCVIRRLKNASTNRIEFKIEEEVVDEGAESSERVAAASAINSSDCNKLPEEMQLQDKSMASSSSKSPAISKRDEEVAVEDFGKNDLAGTYVFYDDIHDLCGLFVALYKDSSDEVRRFYYSKNFVKEWNPEEERNPNQFMAIRWKYYSGMEKEMDIRLDPDEIVLVPPSMTLQKLKEDAQTALRDTYCIMKDFTATQIVPFSAKDHGKLVSATIDTGETVWVKGSELHCSAYFTYVDGIGSLTVGCICGAKYHDGERFAECVICKASQHTRCRGIDDHKAVPVDFLCSKCDAEVKIELGKSREET